MRTLVCFAILAVLVSPALFASGGTEKLAGQEIVVFSWDVNKPTDSIIAQHIDEFTKATGIKVNHTMMGLGDLNTKVTTVFAAQSNAVDVIATWKGTVNQFVPPGYLEDITNQLPAGYADGMTGAINSFKYKNKVYGLPYFQSFRFFYYNKKILKDAGFDPNKPPKTWDDVVAIAKATTKDVNGDGKIDQWGFLPSGIGAADKPGMDFELFYYLCGGGSLFDENDVATFNSPAGLKALKFYKSLYDLGVIDPASWTIGSGTDRRNRYIQGVTAMVIEWPALWTLATKAEASKIKSDVAICPMPAIDRIASISGDEGLSVSAFSDKKKAALEFIKFISSQAVNKENTLRVGWLPVQKSVAADQQVRANPTLLPMLTVADEQNKYFMERFATPYGTEVTNEALGVAIVKAVKGEMTPEDALKWAADKSKDIVATYKKK